MKFWPLRITIPLALLASSFFIILLNAGIEFREERLAFFDDTERSSNFIGYRLAQTLEKRIRANQTAEIDDELGHIATVGSLKRASVVDASGQIKHSTDPRFIGQSLLTLECVLSDADRDAMAANTSARIIRKSSGLCAYYPIRFPAMQNSLRGSETGLLVLNFDLTHLEQKVLWEATTRALISAGVTLFITFLLYLWLSQRLTQRLASLASAAKHHLQGGSADDFKGEHDEIGQLGMELVRLSRESAATKAELEKTAQLLTQNEERLQLALQGSNEGLWDWNILNNEVYFSTRWKAMIGFSEDEISENIDEWRRRIHPDDLEAALAAVKLHFEGKAAKYENIHRMLHKDGRWIWILDRGEVVRDAQGNPVRMVGTHTDISERMQNEEERRLAASVFNNILDGLMITDAEANITQVNRAFTEITGYTSEEVIGMNPSLLQSGRHDHEFYVAMWTALLKENVWQGELWDRRKDGEIFVARQSITALRDQNGKISHFIGLFYDISAYVNKLQKLERLTHYDALTGLPNRMLLADRLLQAMDRCRRQRDLLAVCFLDLDGFKPVNDRYGHAVGDQLLIEISWRLNNMVRAGDTVARLGGDEFVLIIGGVTDEAELAQALDRVIHAIAEPCTIEGAVVSVGSSIGVTLYPRDDSDADSLINHADAAMYLAKDAGKGVWRIYPTAPATA